MASTHSPRKRFTHVFVITCCALMMVVAAYQTKSHWMSLLSSTGSSEGSAENPAADDSQHGHNHGQTSQSRVASISLSDRGLKNIGFKPFLVKKVDYQKSLKLPAMVVERPGRSQIHITAPLTGAVTAIHAVNGEAVNPNDHLFDLRLTHEELVMAQRDYLATRSNLEIAKREIARMNSLGEGVIAGKRILEQIYEKQKLEVSLMASEQAMLLHGLSEEQIEEIHKTQRLFRSLSVRAPEHTDKEEGCQGPHLFTIQRLSVAQGEQIEAGDELAVLADHCELHIEGLAFEDDATHIRKATELNKKVTAHPINDSSSDAMIQGLEVLYVADQIDLESRALKVYLRLPNEVALDKKSSSGKRFLEWRYKPGQRMQIRIPVETWHQQIVLPATAVIDEGAEAYVYRQNGEQFDQIPVHVLIREQNSVVLSDDGAVFPGDRLAGDGAYQMHLALKNKIDGGIDPHAGHNH